MDIDWFDGSMLINIGAIFYIIGFAVRGELILRSLTLLGNAFYLGYYLFIPEITFWGAIVSTVLMTVANIVVMGRIEMEKRTWGMSEADKALYRQFDNFTPGQFRRLLKIATRLSGAQTAQLTEEGTVPQRLYFIADGEVQLSKGTDRFTLPAHNFVGEIGWLLARPASASADGAAGARLIAWNSEDLRSLCAKWPEINNALRARINRDMAEKLAESVRVV